MEIVYLINTAQLRHHQGNADLYEIDTCLYSPHDALIVRNIYVGILWVFICEKWPSIPVLSAIET